MNKYKRFAAAFLTAVIIMVTQTMPALAAEMPFAGATASQQAEINSALDALPEQIVALLGKYQRQVASRDVLAALNGRPAGAGEEWTGFVRAAYLPSSHQLITREVYIAARPGTTKVEMFHEIGHIVDDEHIEMIHHLASDSPEFQQIFLEEAPLAVMRPYNKTNTQEYFAESFCLLYTNPAALAACPKTVTFIQTIIAGLCN